MSTKGYHSYRGRRSARQYLVTGALLAVVLLAGAYMFLQRYVSYADDGSLQFDFPFWREEEPEQADPTAQPEMNLVIDDTPDAGDEPEVTAEPYGEHRLLELRQLPADGAALTDALAAAGANGFVYTVRDNTGRVFWPSASALRSAVESAADSGQLTELCTQEGTISVARFNCLHDSYYAWANMEEAGICQSSGYIWYDNLSYHWLDADKEKARQYVVSLARECAELGFDEILLEDLCYPTDGRTEKIGDTGSTADKTQALAQLLQQLRQTVEPYGTGITLLLDSRLLDDTRREAYVSASGVDLSVLLPLVDAVYVETEDAAAAEQALAALTDGDVPPLIPVVGQPTEADSWYLADGTAG